MSEHTFLLILAVLLVIVIVALLSFLSAVLWQLVRILRELYGIAKNARMGSDALTKDVSAVRKQVERTIIAIAERFSAWRRRNGNPSDSSDSQREEE